MRAYPVLAALVALFVLSGNTIGTYGPAYWKAEWPRTDFLRTLVDYDEILSGGPPKDGIPSIDNPRFEPVGAVTAIGDAEPVITLTVADVARAYPVRILMWHEIVNDKIAGVPVAVTYCPLCNSAIVFDRRWGGRILEFGTTGKLRHSDMIMYDRETESWWQQHVGTAIVGELINAKLAMIPSRMEPFAAFRERHPDGAVLMAPAPVQRRYGTNPYVGYDTANWPFLYRGTYDGPVPPLSYVVEVGDEAWPLERVRREGRIVAGDLVIEWVPGMVSALDTAEIARGRELGAVHVTRGGQAVPFTTPFAFAFKAFRPSGTIHAP